MPVNKLQNPFTVSMEVKGEGMTMVVKRKSKFTSELKLSVGPLKLRNILWLVSERKMDEVLLGRPLMEELGLDVVEH